MLRRTFYETVLVVLVAIILALAAYFFRPEALSRITTKDKQPNSSSQQLFTPITIETAKSLFGKGQVVFADSRPEEAFEEGHIDGAIHLDPNDFDQWSSRLMDQMQPDQIFVTYCDGLQCPLARQLAEKLASLGFEKVFYLEDGWTQWQSHQMPKGKVE